MRIGLLPVLSWFVISTIFSTSTPATTMSQSNNASQPVTLHPELDTDSVIRNPACGWILYDDAYQHVADAKEYWEKQDQAARQYASIFYVRWRWSNMEPTEGHYAWKEDDNYKALIQGALDRGLRLAFRVYIDGWDNSEPGTPQYVFDAGAKGVMHPGSEAGNGKQFKCPFGDDPIFRQKFEKFLDAFAQEYNDPTRVDFVDGLGLGRWGEGHTLTVSNNSHTADTYLWVAKAYDQRFTHTLLAWNLGNNLVDLGYGQCNQAARFYSSSRRHRQLLVQRSTNRHQPASFPARSLLWGTLLLE